MTSSAVLGAEDFFGSVARVSLTSLLAGICRLGRVIGDFFVNWWSHTETFFRTCSCGRACDHCSCFSQCFEKIKAIKWRVPESALQQQQRAFEAAQQQHVGIAQTVAGAAPAIGAGEGVFGKIAEAGAETLQEKLLEKEKAEAAAKQKLLDEKNKNNNSQQGGYGGTNDFSDAENNDDDEKKHSSSINFNNNDDDDQEDDKTSLIKKKKDSGDDDVPMKNNPSSCRKFVLVSDTKPTATTTTTTNTTATPKVYSGSVLPPKVGQLGGGGAVNQQQQQQQKSAAVSTTKQEVKMIFCTQCGKKIQASHKFCKFCGSRNN